MDQLIETHHWNQYFSVLSLLLRYQGTLPLSAEGNFQGHLHVFLYVYLPKERERKRKRFMKENWKVAADQTAAEVVPKDVKEGHFAVFAVEGAEKEKARRFIVELSCLSDPAFLKLLEKAEEEFGFQQGVLSLPCKPDELRRITSKHNNS